MRRLLAFAWLILILAASPAAWAQDDAQPRIALVIGNSQYRSDGIPDLKNPANDAADVARVLKGFGFSVELKLDLDKSTMTSVMTDFGQAAKHASVALFYYSGHGLQMDLRNYLVPTDAVYQTAADVANRSVPVDVLTTAAEGMSGSLLIFLDACQENPVGGRAGLARIPVSRNQFVALAALPDSLAADGAGRNSPFSGAFIADAGVPGRNISDVMLQVRVDVLKATGSQVPWDNSSLTQDVVLVPGEASVLPPETMLWQTASSLSDPELLNVYLQKFPDGGHVSDARTLLASIETKTPAVTETRSTPPLDDPFKQEEELWQLASNSRWRPLVAAYIERFPQGGHVGEAKELAAVLQDPDDPHQPATFTCERLATHPNDETATFAGVPAERLAANAPAAIAACQAAHDAYPDVHKYTALLARALYLGGQTDRAIRLFEAAAAAGNIRAMTTLGAFYETGTGVPKDLVKAADFYQRATAAGASDAAVNLARMLAEAKGLPQDIPRAIKLLQDASAAGSAEAAFNLGVLALSNQGLPPADAAKYFSLASDRGFTEGHFRAALLYETNEFGEHDPKRAAEYLLRAVASDSGTMLDWMSSRKVKFGSDTISEVQRRLANLNDFHAKVDGQFGPQTVEALRVYRFGGLTPPQATAGG